jgi:hypothetical protein
MTFLTFSFEIALCDSADMPLAAAIAFLDPLIWTPWLHLDTITNDHRNF